MNMLSSECDLSLPAKYKKRDWSHLLASIVGGSSFLSLAVLACLIRSSNLDSHSVSFFTSTSSSILECRVCERERERELYDLK